MTRGPSQVEQRAAVADRAWNLVRTLPKFGYGEIEVGVKVGRDFARRIVARWIAQGAIHDAEPVRKRRMWRADPDFVFPEQVGPRSPESNMWTAMRKLGVFCDTDVLAHAVTEDVPVDRSDVQGYLRALLATGYLRVSRRADPRLHREAIYRLIEVNGPHAPVVRRVPAVEDPNTGELRVIRGVS